MFAAREAASFHTPATRNLVDKMYEIAERENADEFARANREFHEALYEPCRNAVLKSEIKSLWDMVWRERTYSIFVEEPARLKGAAAEHDAIVTALEQGGSNAVENAMAFHRNQTMRSWNRLRAAEE